LLDGFWDEARSFGLDLPTPEPISAASFCSARPKVTPGLLRCMLNDLASDSRETSFGSRRWHGRRVFAVDGTKINLRRDPDLAREFGVPKGCHCPQILVSVLLDVCAKAPVDVTVDSASGSERAQLLEMLPMLERGDVVILDRGYPSHEVLQDLESRGLDFLMRLPSSHTFWAVDDMADRPGRDYLYFVDPPPGSPSHWKQITVRCIRVKAPDGSETFFFTSLRKPEFSRAQLRDLYHLRWEAEEFYKLLKGPYIGQGQFRSKSPEGVRQEIHALVLFLGVARVLMAEAAEVTGEDYENLSQKAAVLGLAAYVARLFLSADTVYARRELQALVRRITRRSQRPRPERSFPRRSFRPHRKWGPQGRCGG